MKHIPAALSFAAALGLCSSGTALAQAPAPPPPPGAQPAPTDVVPAPVQPTSPAAGTQVAPPAYPAPAYAEAQPPTSGPGQWVYTTDYGWIWVPSEANTVLYSGVPYTYLYTPTSGWSWYVSPWGPGRYHSGNWVRHAWHPRTAHAWVAPPTVSVRLEPMRYRAQPHPPAVHREKRRDEGRRGNERR